MNTSHSTQLRLHEADRSPAVEPAVADWAPLDNLASALIPVLGARLKFVPEGGSRLTLQRPTLGGTPIDAGAAGTVGRLVVEPVAEATGNDPPSLERITSAVGGLWGRLLETRHALWQREAELAAGVPVTPHREESQHLAERLEAVLRCGAEAVGCSAAALYLLDGATTELKLRASWGLSADCLLAPARPLPGAAGDLEAMAGHAVVIDDACHAGGWRIPEPAGAAVCVPVASPTNILGTLWLFATDPRGFSHTEVDIAEIVAGRLAADLDRAAVLADALASAAARKQSEQWERTARQWRHCRRPAPSGWDISALSDEAAVADLNFWVDWFGTGESSWLAIAGWTDSNGPDALLFAHSLLGVIRGLTDSEFTDSGSKTHESLNCGELLRRLNTTMVRLSPGGVSAHLWCGQFDETSGRLEWAAAGDARIRGNDDRRVSGGLFPPIAAESETRYRSQTHNLSKGAERRIVRLAAGSRNGHSNQPLTLFSLRRTKESISDLSPNQSGGLP